MSRYRLQAHTNIHSAISFGDRLTAEALTGLIPGAIVHEIASVGLGYPASIDVDLIRPTREEALDELFAAAQQLGYTIIDGEISEAVDATVQSVAVGALTGLGIGATVDNPILGLILAGIGCLAGNWVSSELLNHEVIYHVRRVFPGDWEVTLIPAQSETMLASVARLLAPT